MKENEPKEKASQKWWKLKRCIVLDEDDGEGALEEPYKATYDRLVTLEAKIEVTKELIAVYERPIMAKDMPSWTTNTMSEKMRLLESELAELVKELKI